MASSASASFMQCLVWAFTGCAVCQPVINASSLLCYILQTPKDGIGCDCWTIGWLPGWLADWLTEWVAG
jgi:hypothetical protein